MDKFKDGKSFQDWLRGTQKNTPDVITVDGIVYTKDSYDAAGKEICYGNKRTGNSLSINTADRYGLSKYSDARVEVIESVGYVHSVAYID